MVCEGSAGAARPPDLLLEDDDDDELALTGEVGDAAESNAAEAYEGSIPASLSSLRTCFST